jgi:micrococcal nuclease
MSKREWRQVFFFFALLLSFAATLLRQEPEGVVDTASGTDDWTVTRVADGDTFTAERGGEEVKVRMIGVNTPESVDPRRPVECFGLEASDRLKDLLTGETVTLVEDASQGSTDKYGRALRYVENDGVDIGLQMIAEGFAYEYTYRTPYERQDEYKTAQQMAEAAGEGLWSVAADCPEK